jgi:NAD(P)-dependent dehydrogenase (short-subunit alcohol dehydrogenase family)
MVQRVAESILARHGRVDILVNSAGLNNPQRSWRDQTVDGWDEVIRINLDGTFYCIRAVLPSMRERKAGLVINIASWAGKYTLAMAGGAYNGSKHAVVALTESLNMEECVNGIRACALCPAESRPFWTSAGTAIARERARMLQADGNRKHDPLAR